MSRRIRIVALVAGTLTLTAGLPVAARADVDPVGIGVLRMDPDEHGTFSIPAWTDAAGASLTAVKATIRDGADPVTTVDLTDTGSGLWAPAVPLKLAEDGGPMPHLGDYAVDVTATDSAANSATRVGSGTLDFTLRPEFAADAGGATLTFPDAPVGRNNAGTRAAGVLMGLQPGSGDAVPIADHDVQVVAGADAPQTVATDAQGAFVTANFPLEGDSTFVATFTGDDATVHGSAQTQRAPAAQITAVDLTATPSATRVEPGQKLTISGTVTEVQTHAVVPGVPVRVDFGSYPEGTSWSGTTNAQGQYHVAIPVIAGPYPQWSAVVIAPFVSGPSQTGLITVPNEGAFIGTRITLRSDGWVTAGGTLTTPYGGFVLNGDQTIRLEYSKDGKTNWKVLAHGLDAVGTKQTLGAWGYVAGYYRLYHPTSDDVAHAASTPVHLSRIVTRIAGNDANPEPVHAGGTVTVTGTLEQERSGWHAMPAQRIYLYFQPTGAKKWTYVAGGRTDRHGHATLHGRATRSGRWLLQYFGDTTHFDSYGRADSVTVQ